MDQEKEKMEFHADEVTASESTMMELNESDNEPLPACLDAMAKRIKLTHKVADSECADTQLPDSTGEKHSQNDESEILADLSGYSEFAAEFIQKVMEMDNLTMDQRGTVSMKLLMKSLLFNPLIHATAQVNIKKKEEINKIAFSVDNLYIQFFGSEKTGYDLIVVDIERTRLSVLRSRSMGEKLVELDLNGMIENEVIDLERTGRRWEGGVVNGVCCGYGKEYNDENYVVYEGFMFDNLRVCYGKEYRGIRNNNSGENSLVYDGGYLNRYRYGLGRLYDLNGKVSYDGEWIDNHPVEKKIVLDYDDELLVPLSTEELVLEKKSTLQKLKNIWELFTRNDDDDHEYYPGWRDDYEDEDNDVYGNGKDTTSLYYGEDKEVKDIDLYYFDYNSSYNDEYGGDDERRFSYVDLVDVLYPSQLLSHLKRIEIGNGFELLEYHKLIINGLSALEEIKIGNMPYSVLKIGNNRGGYFRISNCPQLRQLEIGKYGLSSFRQLEILKVDNLQSIKFGDLCFRYADCILQSE